MSEQEKIMIASDIHGSAHWCEKLLEAFGREKPVKLLLLGDILYHGPRNDLPKEYAPKEVIAQLSPLKEKILSSEIWGVDHFLKALFFHQTFIVRINFSEKCLLIIIIFITILIHLRIVFPVVFMHVLDFFLAFENCRICLGKTVIQTFQYILQIFPAVFYIFHEIDHCSSLSYAGKSCRIVT